MTSTEAVTYARYSGDRQREASIDDQARNCARHAEREGLAVGRVYCDRAVSGAVRARPGYLAMLKDADAGRFKLLLVDDLSRLSRDELEMKSALRRLAWRGVRVVGVSDGYDSASKGHKIHAGFKGLMNEIFLDDLRERTHRGMTGQALKGFNCGGRTYGYRNVPIEDPAGRDACGRPRVVAVRYEIHEDQAHIVRRIHEWYAAGHSYKWIAWRLNDEGVASSRGSTWAVSAIKVVLENEMYEGRLIWNRKAWAKHPETGKRTYRERPRSEWIVNENPELRIVPEEVIADVRRRQRRNRGVYPGGACQRTPRYLLSGVLACDECGASMIIVAGGRYGCAAHKARGPAVCRNRATVSRHIAEERILRVIKDRLLEPGNAARFEEEAARILEARREEHERHDADGRLEAAERVRDNIMAAIRQGIVTPGTKEALERAEDELAELRDEAEHRQRWGGPTTLPNAMARYQEAVEQLQERLGRHVGPAREILKSILGEPIRIRRTEHGPVAEIPDHLPTLLAKSLKLRFDFRGCGGPICSTSNAHADQPDQPDPDGQQDQIAPPRRGEPTLVCLAPTRLDSTPHKHRRPKPGRRAR